MFRSHIGYYTGAFFPLSPGTLLNPVSVLALLSVLAFSAASPQWGELAFLVGSAQWGEVAFPAGSWSPQVRCPP